MSNDQNDFRVEPNWSGDPGTRAISNVFGAAFRVDEEWSLKTARGFQWWAHDLRQAIWADEGFIDQGTEIFRLCAVTDFLNDVRISSKKLNDGLGQINARTSHSSAAVFDPQDRSIRLWTICYVHAGTENWLRVDFGAWSILQLIDASELVDEFADSFQGTPAHSDHPRSGKRGSPDEMLSLKRDLVEPEGKGFNRWFQPSELMKVMEMLKENEWEVTHQPLGFSAALPFNESGFMILSIACCTHGQLDQGCLIDLRLPVRIPVDSAMESVADLNLKETKTCSHSHLAGSWMGWPHDDGDGAGVSFIQFMPNILFQEGKLLNLAWSMAAKAQWARQFFRRHE